MILKIYTRTIRTITLSAKTVDGAKLIKINKGMMGNEESKVKGQFVETSGTNLTNFSRSFDFLHQHTIDLNPILNMERIPTRLNPS